MCLQPKLWRAGSDFDRTDVKAGRAAARPGRVGRYLELGADGKLRDRDDNRQMYALGNRLWHSDASFRATGAGYSLLSARVVPEYGGNTEFADMRGIRCIGWQELWWTDLITEHSIAFSRGELGFSDYPEGTPIKCVRYGTAWCARIR